MGAFRITYSRHYRIINLFKDNIINKTDSYVIRTCLLPYSNSFWHNSVMELNVFNRHVLSLQIYTNCTCIQVSSFNSSSDYDKAEAVPGQCPSTCSSFKLLIYVALCALSFFLQALNGNPLIYILLRYVTHC